jgi:hypothetical protein
MNLFLPVLAYTTVQMVTVVLYALILSRYIHRMPLHVWLNTRLGPSSIPEMLVTLVLFLFGTIGSVAAGILAM